MRSRAVHLPMLMLLLMPAFTASPASAQAAGASTWRVGAGAGIAFATDADARRNGAEPAFQLVLERRVADDIALGIEWTGTAFEGTYAHMRRHNVGVAATVYPLDNLFAEVGVGLAIATSVTIDGPPAECCGDIVVGVADPDVGPGLTATVGFDLRVARRWALTPLVGFALQRVAGQTLGFTWLGARLVFDVP